MRTCNSRSLQIQAEHIIRMAGTPTHSTDKQFGTVRFNSSYSLNPMLYSAFIILRLLFLILIIILLRQSNASCSPSTTPRRLFPSSLHVSSSALRSPFMLRFHLLPSFTPLLHYLPLLTRFSFTTPPHLYYSAKAMIDPKGCSVSVFVLLTRLTCRSNAGE